MFGVVPAQQCIKTSPDIRCRAGRYYERVSCCHQRSRVFNTSKNFSRSYRFSCCFGSETGAKHSPGKRRCGLSGRISRDTPSARQTPSHLPPPSPLTQPVDAQSSAQPIGESYARCRRPHTRQQKMRWHRTRRQVARATWRSSGTPGPGFGNRPSRQSIPYPTTSTCST